MTTATSTTESTNHPPSTTNGSSHHNGQSDPARSQENGRQLPALAAPDEGRYVSLEEYWAEWYEAEPNYEWNNGYLEAKPMSNAIQLRLFHWFLMLMRQYITVEQNAELMSLEIGFPLQVPHPKQPGSLKEVVRKPDLAAILHTNPITWGDYERSYRGICDLCVEAISDSTKKEILRDTDIKKSEYEYAGVQEYYILDPSGENMHFYEKSAAGGYVEMQPDAEGVIRSKVLPGFQFRYSDLMRQPTLEEMALDEVYRGFVLLHYQAAEARAEEAEQKVAAAQQEILTAQQAAAAAQQAAAVAQQAAAAEQQRAEQYAAKLRELGINLDEEL